MKNARKDNINPNGSLSGWFKFVPVSEYVFLSKHRKATSPLVRWTAITSVFIAFGFAAIAAVGQISAGNEPVVRTQAQTIWRASAGQNGAEGASYLFDRTTTFAPERRPVVEVAAVQPANSVDPFEQVVKQANLSSENVRKAFGLSPAQEQVAELAKPKKPAKAAVVAKLAPVKPERKTNAAAQPARERFVAPQPDSKASQAIVLAYAARDNSPAAQALHNLAEEEAQLAEDSAVQAMPENAPIPTARPKLARSTVEDAEKPSEAEIEIVKPEARDTRKPAAGKPAAEAKPEREADKPRERHRIARKEDEPKAGGLGFSFRNMFGGTRAGKGVAVYDISARKVYMPDGSVLTAYSGMGKMANNPKYTHVKMNGPTPVHTYNLRMRERRFHGVEAIRMLPVDGKNKHGRDGFLAHSQLVRGQQSHGCVAFPEYDKFLRAFKQGKVKQIVVVASGGRAAASQVAKN